jgi:hypothetical protein
MTPNYVICNLPQAHEVIKQMNLSPDWNSNYGQAARQTLADILENRMKNWMTLPEQRN